MKDEDFKATRQVRWQIPFESPGKGWSLVITREDDSRAISWALHYNEKRIPTHEIVGDVDEFKDMLEELLS